MHQARFNYRQRGTTCIRAAVQHVPKCIPYHHMTTYIMLYCRTKRIQFKGFSTVKKGRKFFFSVSFHFVSFCFTKDTRLFRPDFQRAFQRVYTRALHIDTHSHYHIYTYIPTPLQHTANCFRINWLCVPLYSGFTFRRDLAGKFRQTRYYKRSVLKRLKSEVATVVVFTKERAVLTGVKYLLLKTLYE